jgi:hypothetical protein
MMLKQELTAVQQSRRKTEEKTKDAIQDEEEEGALTSKLRGHKLLCRQLFGVH